MKASKKAKAKLMRRQKDYDDMIESKDIHEQEFYKKAFHRPGSYKK